MVFQSKSEADTRDIGRRLGSSLQRGNVVCLYGDLGAGKTTFVKGIASALGIEDRDITSASYTIIAEYATSIPFYHIDLYRTEQGELADLGLDEYLGRDGIAVIEWAERAESELPENLIKVRLEHIDEQSRSIEINGISI
ncbi:MAG: tRNA (adenosine(37)-N6)-threonylcarbamoyltransferase complex ATPase subunit type 1 TsaE [Nitrospira sp.]|nr:tRNA (adenosine(37)-N6)-threonylcarbamoyltransferase complex ATPase subunit type 1 TsaE [bacterium]MBL7031729.1 tRNA (adenosine(37)-N6)-threonylcarbamoyltransferase complex ATPase subunit type 1 TsaE [Nitrospira sp.]